MKTKGARAPVNRGRGDIWVYGGGCCFWNGGALRYDGETSISDFRARFLKESPYNYSAEPISALSPVAGAGASGALFVLDNTPLYFGSLSVREVFALGELDIASGTLRAGSIRAASGIFINPGCEVYASGEISSGGFIECYGGTVEAAGIDARRVWFDSAGANLNVTVSGSVVTDNYAQHGGDVWIGGGLYGFASGERAGVSVNDQYAYHNGVSLRVGGDIVSGNGKIEVGGAVELFAGGDMRAQGQISFHGGRTFIRKRLECRDKRDGVRVYGGVVNVGDLRVAGPLTVGSGARSAGEATVFVANRLQVGGQLDISGGTVYEGGGLAAQA